MRGGEKVNHAEWKRKVSELEGRFRELEGLEHLGPVQLMEFERILKGLEELLDWRL